MLDAICRLNSGHLLENRTRGAYAEWLVHRALGCQMSIRLMGGVNQVDR